MDKTAAESTENLTPDLTVVVGQAVKRQRQIAGISLRKLADLSGISSAMVSRIENGQVSPSLATLEALADALSLSVVTFFADRTQAADVHFVKAGQGIPATRNYDDHIHEFNILSRHRKSPLDFEAAAVTIERREDNTHPRYIHRGYVFLTVTAGECVYQCGKQEYSMAPGDSLSFDAELIHGVKAVVTESVSYVSVSAKLT